MHTNFKEHSLKRVMPKVKNLPLPQIKLKKENVRTWWSCVQENHLLVGLNNTDSLTLHFIMKTNLELIC